MRLSTIRKMYDNLLDLDIETTKEQRRELLKKLYAVDTDFLWETESGEYRIINEDVIFEVYKDEIRQTTQDNYLNGLDLDNYWWIEIDWEKTAQNVLDTDGYGNHFSHYDGSEEEFKLDGVWYHVFRVG